MKVWNSSHYVTHADMPLPSPFFNSVSVTILLFLSLEESLFPACTDRLFVTENIAKCLCLPLHTHMEMMQVGGKDLFTFQTYEHAWVDTVSERFIISACSIFLPLFLLFSCSQGQAWRTSSILLPTNCICKSLHIFSTSLQRKGWFRKEPLNAITGRPHRSTTSPFLMGTSQWEVGFAQSGQDCNTPNSNVYILSIGI